MENADIARALERVAQLLELKGANPFRVRAYSNAARIVESYAEPLRKLVAEGHDLREISGIGKDMAHYIEELVRTGRLGILDELEREVPLGLIDVMRLPSVGPRRAAQLWHELGVTSLEALADAARQGRVAQLKGLGHKTEKTILERIGEYQAQEKRFSLSEADEHVESLRSHLAQAPGIDELEVAGSWRRRKESVGDLDVLVTTDAPGPVMEHFARWARVARVLASGETKASVVLQSGLQVDLRVVAPKSFGAALVYFTGSKAHNIKLRKRALERRLRISEYGVFRMEDRPEGGAVKPSEGPWVAGRTERDVYAAVELPWIAPELREDRGEVEAAVEGRLPRLLELRDIRGDLQLHTTWTDGRDSLERMVAACASRGYQYMAVTDHSRSLPRAGGLDAAAVRRQMAAIEEVAARHDGIVVLKGLEVDILEDGSLDLDDATLQELDYVLVAVHSRFDLPLRRQTARIVKALQHPCVHALGHPTARIIGKRKPLELDLDEVLHCAREQDVAVELDAHPRRLDLRDTELVHARDVGVKIIISSDAHSVAGLGAMRYGVEQARRAGLEKKDVLNTLPAKRFIRALAGK